jgi:hypothetical protein
MSGSFLAIAEDLTSQLIACTHITDKHQFCPAPHPDYYCFNDFERCIGLDPARNFQAICEAKCTKGLKYFVAPNNGAEASLNNSCVCA